MKSVTNFGEVAVCLDLLAEGVCHLCDEIKSAQKVVGTTGADTTDIYWNLPDCQIPSLLNGMAPV